MKIYIAYTYNDEPYSVLLSDDQKKAEIAWAAMGESPHRVEEIDPQNITGGINGLVFLLSSTEFNSRHFEADSFQGFNFRIWKRGN